MIRSTEPESTDEEPDVDIVEKCIGGLGRWQILIFIVISFVRFPVAWHTLSIIFLAPPVDFTCLDAQVTICSSNCTEYIYDRSIFTETIVTQWDLVCGTSSLANLAQTIEMLGVLIGNSFFGYLSDRFGRRVIMISTLALQVICGTLQAFVPWLPGFLVLRFLTATAIGGLMMTSFVMVMEIIGVKWRTALGIIYQIPDSLGHATLPLLAYFFRDWRNLQLAISLIPILLFLCYWFLPESPRWLLSVKEERKSIAVLTSIAKHNKFPTDSIGDNVQNYLRKKDLSKANTANVLDLFRIPIIRKYSICLGFNWLSCGLCFYGTSLYIGKLDGDIFINVALSAIVSIPGTLFPLYALRAWGRKVSLISGNLLAALSFLILATVPPHLDWVRISLSLVTIFGIVISVTTVYIYSGELFPTPLRNVGVGTASMWARAGSMVAPFTAGLKEPWLPPLIFGISALIGAVLCLKLPETLDCKLPDTIEEAEEFAIQKPKKSEKTRIK